MSDQSSSAQPSTAGSSFTTSRRVVLIAVVVLALVAGAATWYLLTRGRESTDDAQIDADVTTISTRIGGTVLRVPVGDNQLVEEGTVLAEIDPLDYRIAVEKARAELADAEAAAAAAQSGVPITTTTTASTETAARGSLDQVRSGVEAAGIEVDLAKARLVTARARQREAEANATKSARDVERLRGLLAKDEVSQQFFDAAVATAAAQQASVDSTTSQVAEAEAAIKVAESRLRQSRSGEEQAQANLRSAQTAPEQVAATKARALSAQAHVQQAKAMLDQAEANLQHATVKSPAKGIVSKKSITPGQVVQANQPLMAIVRTGTVWVTANFKETQLNDIRAGQRATVDVDAYGGHRFTGRVDSIAAATGSRFSLLPPENATGNFVKVVQRVPVKIVVDETEDPERPLRPGMSVTATVYK